MYMPRSVRADIPQRKETRNALKGVLMENERSKEYLCAPCPAKKGLEIKDRKHEPPDVFRAKVTSGLHRQLQNTC
jgi:hypothetical protein